MATKEQLREEEVEKFIPKEKLKSGALRFNKLSKGQMIFLSEAILKFSEYLADSELYPYQREFGFRIIYSVLTADGKEITGLFARQSGKTETVATVVNGMMVVLPILAQFIKDIRISRFKKGFWAGIFAPTKEQAGILHGRMISKLHNSHAHKILREEDIDIHFDDEKRYIDTKLPSGSFSRTHSAAKNAKIEGPTYHLLICEESQDISPSVYKKSISPMGAATNASQVKIGTCNQKRSDFYEGTQRNAGRDVLVRNRRFRNHYQFDYEVASKYNQFYAAYIQNEIERLGFDSDEFRMAYRLHWLLERGMLIEPSLFELMGRSYSLITFSAATPVVAGIDVAKERASTVVTIIEPDYTKGVQVGKEFRCYKKVYNWLELRGDDYVSQAKLIVDFLSNYRKLFRICIDASGVGNALADMLASFYGPKISDGELNFIRFTASKESNHDGYMKLLGDLQNQRIEYPASDRAKRYVKQQTFIRQMLGVQKEYIGPYLSVGIGEEQDEKLQKDFVSSLMLGLLAADSDFSIPVVESQDTGRVLQNQSSRASSSLVGSRGLAAVRSRGLAATRGRSRNGLGRTRL